MSDLNSNRGLPLLAVAELSTASHYGFPCSARPHVMMPRNHRAAQAALRLLMPRNKCIWLSMQSVIDRLKNARSWFRETQLMSEIRQATGMNNYTSVVVKGTPGPYSKDVVLFFDSDADPVLLLKVGTSLPARRLLENEAIWLERLNQAGLAAHVPRVLSRCDVDHARVLGQSVGTGRFPGAKMSNHILGFLSDFQVAFPGIASYQNSTLRIVLEDRFHALRSCISQVWLTRIHKTIEMLSDEFQGRRIPFCAAHRDFAPWNMRITDRGLFLYDWEYASDGYTPLYDLFHFFVMPHALKHQVSTTQLTMIIGQVIAKATLLKDARAKVQLPDYQLLAYLLDVCLFYLESNNGKHEGDRIVCRYGDLIDQFPQWRMQ